MPEITARNLTNSPMDFIDVTHARVRFPAGGTGTGTFDGEQLKLIKFFADAGGLDTDPTIAPENVEPPTVTGTAQVGETLTTDPGEWSGMPAPDLVIQWEADGEPIEGANETTYELVEGDIDKVITVTVTATNIAGLASATSEPTDPVEAGE